MQFFNHRCSEPNVNPITGVGVEEEISARSKADRIVDPR
jgi:hypothetical protein